MKRDGRGRGGNYDGPTSGGDEMSCHAVRTMTSDDKRAAAAPYAGAILGLRCRLVTVAHSLSAQTNQSTNQLLANQHLEKLTVAASRS